MRMNQNNLTEFSIRSILTLDSSGLKYWSESNQKKKNSILFDANLLKNNPKFLMRIKIEFDLIQMNPRSEWFRWILNWINSNLGFIRIEKLILVNPRKKNSILFDAHRLKNNPKFLMRLKIEFDSIQMNLRSEWFEWILNWINSNLGFIRIKKLIWVNPKKKFLISVDANRLKTNPRFESEPKLNSI